MIKQNRWLCLFLAFLLFAGPALPAQAAEADFASFLIDGDEMDFPQRPLHIQLYQRDQTGTFVPSDQVVGSFPLNRTAGNTTFYIQLHADGVQVTVDYLTDANSDGVYELLDGQDDPICDVVTADGRLTAWDGVDHRLEEGQIFALPADLLASRGQAVLQGRLAAGQEDVDPDHLIYLLSLSYVPAGGGEPQTLHYYLQLFQSVIIPSDVPVGSWYYEAVEYGLAQGFFSGTGEDSFSPQGTVTRAQLAQILWRLGGSEEGREVSFTDVSSGDWFLDAACWCAQEGVMSGVGDQRFGPNQVLSREQLALILYQYARRTGLQMEGGQSLALFTDGPSTSSWAREALGWAVDHQLLSGYEDGSLHPGQGVTRAELAVALYRFCQDLLEI